MQVYLTESVHDHTAQFNVQDYSCQWLSVCDPPPPFDNVASIYYLKKQIWREEREGASVISHKCMSSRYFG